MSSPENNNEQKTQSKKVSSEDYNLLLSARSVMGPSFNLTPPIINLQDEEIEDNISDNEVVDMFYCIDIVDKDRKSEYAPNIKEYYDKLMSEAKTSKNKKKQKIYVYAMRCCIIEAEEFQVNGKFRQALSSLDRGTRQFKIRDPYLLNFLYFKYAELYMESFSYNKALDVIKKAIQLNETLQFHVYLADSLVRLGQIYYLFCNFFIIININKAQFEDSRKLFVHSLSIYDNYIDKDDPRVAHIYNQLGIMCFMKGDYFQADKYFSMSIDILKDIEGYNLLKIQTYNGMGIVSQMQGINEHGLIYFNKALEISDYCQISKAKILSNIGNVHKLKGNLKDSISIFQQAIDIFSKVLPTWHASYKKVEKTSQNLIQTLKQQNKKTI